MSEERKNAATAGPARKVATKEAASETAQRPGARKAQAAEAAKQTGKKKANTEAAIKRTLAVVGWILAITCEVLSLLLLSGKLSREGSVALWTIGLLVTDLILMLTASACWKRANYIDPPSKKDRVRFFLQNNLGMILGVLCFLPYFILLLNNRNLDGKGRRTTLLAAVAAAVALALLWIL